MGIPIPIFSDDPSPLNDADIHPVIEIGIYQSDLDSGDDVLPALIDSDDDSDYDDSDDDSLPPLVSSEMVTFLNDFKARIYKFLLSSARSDYQSHYGLRPLSLEEVSNLADIPIWEEWVTMRGLRGTEFH
jgi:hypothetical protein